MKQTDKIDFSLNNRITSAQSNSDLHQRIPDQTNHQKSHKASINPKKDPAIYPPAQISIL